jgi:hypothetical protein
VNPTETVCPSKWVTEQPDQKALVAVAAPLIAVGVSFAAGYIVNSISKALDEYKSGLSGSFGAAGIAEVVNSHGEVQAFTPKDIHCIVIVRGLMGEGGQPTVTDDTDFLAKFYPSLGFKDYPAFYLELTASQHEVPTMSAEPGAPTKRLTLKPTYLSYAASVAKNSGSGRKHVGVALAFSDTTQKKPNEINEEKTFAIFHHDLGRLEIGKRYEDRDAMKLLQGTAASASLTEDSLKKSSFNIYAVVSESEDPGIAFQVLSVTFTSKKADLQKALEEMFTNLLEKKKNP